LSESEPRSGLRWRRLNNAVHRDTGYAVAALTLVYAVSGLAVNHAEDWNPSYAERKEHRTVAPIPDGPLEAMVEEARGRLALAPPLSFHRPDEATLQLFYELKTVSFDRPSGNVIIETTSPRPVLRELNDLHLNNLKGWWTLVADLYALSLIVLVLTGLFVLRGRVGITGRGAWIAGAGALVPIAFLLLRALAG
jgi:hypothetical protein